MDQSAPQVLQSSIFIATVCKISNQMYINTAKFLMKQLSFTGIFVSRRNGSETAIKDRPFETICVDLQPLKAFFRLLLCSNNILILKPQHNLPPPQKTHYQSNFK